MGSEHYCLRWNNHQSNLLGVFSQLLRDESLVDVTLACSEGHSIRAHKVVLSACSSYFQTLFVDHPSRHPIVILKDVRFAELRTLIEFMYKGEVNVEYCQLSALLKTAESLKVKGLAEMTREYKQEPEQTEPKELIKRQQSPVSPMMDERLQHQERSTPSPPPSVLAPSSGLMMATARNRSPIHHPSEKMSAEGNDRDHSPENSRHSPSDEPSDMSIHSNSNNMVACSSGMNPPICSRLPSPIGSEPLPGPSNMPPVQQVPLSLKKEVDWSGGGGGGGAGLDDKNQGESSSDFTRHPHHDSGEERPGSSPMERPSSTQSSRSSTPFPFPSLPLLDLIHPTLLTDEMFRCQSCMAAFPSIWLLEQHTALQHIGALNSTQEKPFICEQCGQSYRYRSAYVKHREQNHRARLPADKLFSCDVCGMQFRYLKSFKKHRLNHALEKLHGRGGGGGGGGGGAGEGDGGTRDNSSDQVSSSNETIVLGDGKEDDNQGDVEIKKETSADDCIGEGASDVEKMEAEQDDTIDSMAALPYSVSPVAAANLEILRNSRHDSSSIMSFLRADAVEKQRERRFACPFCGKCVRSKENLKLHVRKHTGERPFVCLFCGRAFGGKSDLTRHLRIHTGERPYHCDMCGKCFARADYLSKHLTTHINTSR